MRGADPHGHALELDERGYLEALEKLQDEYGELLDQEHDRAAA